MPSRNVYKVYHEDGYYHVYNRGVNKQAIFINDEDYIVLLGLFRRFVGDKAQKDKLGRVSKWYGDRLELLAFCLMPNHFHILWFQHDASAITDVMRSITNSYVKYFNRKYSRIGPLFQQRFRAAHINDDVYLQHISRYIHLNPANYSQWRWSSLQNYLGKKEASWVRPKRILDLFDTAQQYANFIAHHKNEQDALKSVKEEIGY